VAKRPIVVVPIAFVSEHSETLVELDIEYRKLDDESGAPCYLRVSTPAPGSFFEPLPTLGFSASTSSDNASGTALVPG
jgi:ferrochelatase